MEILSVKTQRVWLELSYNTSLGANRVDLLTGPNGSGKSEILSFLANTFRGGKTKPPEGEINWKGEPSYLDDGLWADPYEPERVIAQTYSPFNRFPSPLDHDFSLTKVYSEGVETNSSYVCAGLHKSTRLVSSSLSKHTLEQAIYRLSESLDSVGSILKVLENLKLSDRFDFTYEARPELRSLQNAFRRGDILKYLEDRRQDSFNRKYPRSGLDQELRKDNASDLAALIAEAFEILGSDIYDSRVFRRGLGSIGNSNRYDYAAFQSLSLLRRLDLLTLRQCELTSISGEVFDVANASSGQQQMLCSVIGLATALRNDSLVLIDEPELSLHPRWQQLYLDSLFAILKPFHGCHVLIATHSPLIVQRGRVLGAGVNQVNKEAVSELIAQEGASVEATLQDVFDTPVAGSVHLANQIFTLITNAESGDESVLIESLSQLKRLEALYSSQNYGDYKSLGLIRDAIQLVNMSEGADV